MSRPVRGEGYVALGAELRRIRKAAGKNIDQVPGYSASHVSLAERGMAHISRDFIEAYVTLGGDRTRLLELYFQAKSDGDEGRYNRRSYDSSLTLDADSPLNEIAKTYRTERMEDTYYFAGSGAIQFVAHVMYVRAVAQAARFYAYYVSYINDERPGVLGIEASRGCKIARLEESEKGHITVIFELDRTLTPEDDETFAFSFSVQVRSDVPCSPLLRSYAYRQLAHYALRIQFTEPAVPSRIWWFRGNYHMEAEGSYNESRVLEATGDNFYFQDFSDLREEYWGVAWDWSISG